MIKGILNVAGPFGPKEIAAVEERFSTLLGDRVLLDVREDKELIGGFMAMIGGKVYDATILAHLKDIRRYLLDKE